MFDWYVRADGAYWTGRRLWRKSLSWPEGPQSSGNGFVESAGDPNEMARLAWELQNGDHWAALQRQAEVLPIDQVRTEGMTNVPASLGVERNRVALISIFSVAISMFTIYEVNYASLTPLTQLAVFALLGSAICFLMFPVHKRWKDVRWLRVCDIGLAVLFAICCGYLISEGQALTNDRAGDYTTLDHWVAILATLLVLESTRRSIGLALPLLKELDGAVHKVEHREVRHDGELGAPPHTHL